MGTDGTEALIPIAVIVALLTSMLFLFRVVPWRKRGSWRWIWLLATIAALMAILAEAVALELEGTQAVGATFQAPLFVAVLASAAGFFLVYTDVLRAAESDRILALTDAPTGLPNARAFQERLRLSFEARHKEPFSVMYMDLDGFKKVNDGLGHDAGDRVLKHTAGILAGAVRQVDMVARIGGDEFAFVLPGAEPSAARIVADRALLGLREMDVSDGLPVSASFGAAFSSQAKGAAELLAMADAAMYATKRAGGDGVRLAKQTDVGEAHAAV